MKFTDSLDGDIVHFQLSGKIMSHEDSMTRFHGQMHEYINLNKKSVVIDLSKIEMMTSVGLGMLISALATVRNAGGRMVWTGDAAAELGLGDQYLYEDEVREDANHAIIGPWARKDSDGYIVNLENYISVSYQGNYCQLTGCDPDTLFLAGSLQPAEDTDHPLIYGMQSGIEFKGDFAVTTIKSGVGTNQVLNIDTDTALVAGGKSLGQIAPMIVTSGVGEKIAYYAFPPEQLAKLDYRVLMENMYYGMLE